MLDCFVEAGSELQRTQVAPEADAFTFAQIAGHAGVTVTIEDPSEASATDVLTLLRTVKGVCATSTAYKRAVCAAVDAFAEFGAGEVGGYTIGSFTVWNYEHQGHHGRRACHPGGLARAGVVRDGVLRGALMRMFRPIPRAALPDVMLKDYLRSRL